MQYFGLISLLVTMAIIGWWFSLSNLAIAPSSLEKVPVEIVLDPAIVAEIETHANIVQIESPLPNQLIKSPFTVTGQARGPWYFEASFPVVLTNWDGLIIAEGLATAQEEWMTEDFVPFTATLTFENLYRVGDPDFMQRGSLILKKDNPSGLPEHDDALEIPVRFTATGEVVPPQNPTSYKEAIDAAKGAAHSLER